MSHTNKITQLENDRTSWLRKFSRPAALTMKSVFFFFSNMSDNIFKTCITKHPRMHIH